MTMEQGSFDDFKGELSYIQASRIEIETGREMDADTDGEVYGTTPCTIEVKNIISLCLFPRIHNENKKTPFAARAKGVF